MVSTSLTFPLSKRFSALGKTASKFYTVPTYNSAIVTSCWYDEGRQRVLSEKIASLKQSQICGFTAGWPILNTLADPPPAQMGKTYTFRTDPNCPKRLRAFINRLHDRVETAIGEH